jgi:hypothetical protein
VLIGSLLLLIGVFMPLFSVPIFGGLSYFQMYRINGIIDALIILIIAVVSLLLVYTDFFELLFFTGLGSFALIAYRLYIIMTANVPFLNFELGWLVLFLGSVLLMATAGKDGDKSKSETIKQGTILSKARDNSLQ